jgi:hypothetical protein
MMSRDPDLDFLLLVTLGLLLLVFALTVVPGMSHPKASASFGTVVS